MEAVTRPQIFEQMASLADGVRSRILLALERRERLAERSSHLAMNVHGEGLHGLAKRS